MPAELRRTPDGLTLELTGESGAREFGTLERELAAVPLAPGAQLKVDARALARLELPGAWALQRFLARATEAGTQVEFVGGMPESLRLLAETLPAASQDPPAPAAPAVPAWQHALAVVGRRAYRVRDEYTEGLAFLGRTVVTALPGLWRPRRLRPVSIARHVYDTGITALPIVSLIAFLISVIIAYMSARQLQGLGADIYVVDLVTIGVLRELGVLLTSIIVAGRSGSSFAAELGSMKLNEEVDALTATGVDPFAALVVPRVAGLIVALPLLTVVADFVGLGGGAVLCRYLLDMPFSQYFARVNEAISSTTFWVGVVKAPVFALLIATAGCYRGLQVRASARELGRLVTVAVVQSIFLVILADALFAVLFMEMNV